ncbi:kinase-like protein [Cylindrobasidium torrendii FP15055 ss-10]|uniref:Kinase-like protein n=1 Tax=Cylindrobasidium torrendii FP15055 ss-10 TaxID=1314674 RepID=A0A0D7BJ41_9AGAR|nr:kinase-like protein [Cylindrobasidium torrendii FP15055 ss-10]
MPAKTSAPTTANHPPLIDDGSLELVEVLGVGGYGVVYRAEETFTTCPRSYAVKCLSQTYGSNRQRQLHLREIALHQAASAHPNVASLYRVVEDNRHMFIIMEYAPDADLFSQILHDCRYLGQDHLIRHVFLQLLDAVEYCHSLGIYHRDLKPENVLCFDDGLRVAITDFGLATTDKVSSEFRTGSVYHMSPECQGGEFALSGNYSPMSNDVWSLGIILLNLATGRNPWKSATLGDATFQAYLRDPLHFLPSVLPISDELNDVLVRMLEVDWMRRMPLHEVRAALEDVTSYYADDAVFEGSMARCAWEVEMDMDMAVDQANTDEEEEEEEEADEVEASVSVVEPQSCWSSDTDSDIVFAEPSPTTEWSSSATSSPLFVRPQTPATPSRSRSLSSSPANSVFSFPSTPDSTQTTFGEHPRPSRPSLAINTDLKPGIASYDSYPSSFMKTAVEYVQYGIEDDVDSSSIFLPSAVEYSKESVTLVEDGLSVSDKDMSFPPSPISSMRSFYELAADETTKSRNPSNGHVHPFPQRMSLSMSSMSSRNVQPSPTMAQPIPIPIPRLAQPFDDMPPAPKPNQHHHTLTSRAKSKFFDFFPRTARTPSPSPPAPAWLQDPIRPDAFGGMRGQRPTTLSLRSRPWFLPNKLFPASAIAAAG